MVLAIGAFKLCPFLLLRSARLSIDDGVCGAVSVFTMKTKAITTINKWQAHNESSANLKVQSMSMCCVPSLLGTGENIKQQQCPANRYPKVQTEVFECCEDTK